jgi:ABC-type antimicrobial peptide transport system permease subunit
MLGVFGIGVSIFLLTSVSFLTDSVSNSFVDFLTTDAGGQDLNLEMSGFDYTEGNGSQYFEYQKIINKIQANVSEIEHFIPRMSQYGRFNYTIQRPMENLTYQVWTRINALDLAYEEQIKFGQFIDLRSGLELSQGLPTNTCIISAEFANAYGLSIGDVIPIQLNIINSTTVNLTIISTYNHILKFPLYDYTNIVVDLNWWGTTVNQVQPANATFNWEMRASQLIMTLKDRQNLYDIRNIRASEDNMRKVGEKIILTLGIEAWSLDYPILENLAYSEFLTVGTQIIFVMISFIAMLISGILINGILTTSVEERIREYGVNRVLGARKIYNLKLIVIQGVIMSLFGTTLGIFGSFLFVKFGALPLVNSLIPEGYLTNQVTYVFNPMSVILSYLIGVGVSMVVSIFPALKVMKMKIVESINPYRHEEAVYKLERDTSANTKLIIFGLILASNGLFLYSVVPQVILTFNIGLIVGILLATMLIFLIGISLLALGLIPIMIRVLLLVFKPFSRKLYNIIKITIFRYQRRNMSTSILFVLSFSFIMFTTSIVEIQQSQIGGLIQYEAGADIQVIPTSYDIRAPGAELQKKLMTIEGIERTSAVLASTHDLNQIYAEDGKTFTAQLGDYINYARYNIRLYGIDKNYKDTIYSQEFMKFTEGKREEAFARVFNESETNIIISTALSNSLDLKVGDVSRLTFNRGDESVIVIATIVGVASNMPGLNRFKANSFEASQGGVIIANFHYLKYFNIPAGDNAYVDRIYVKVMDHHQAAVVAQNIQKEFGEEYDIYIRDTNRMIEGSAESFVIIKYVLTLILIGTVVIGLFGLISSSYSSILERRREIAIVRTLGLYPTEVNKMFQIENMILLFSSGGSGGVIGFLLAYMLSQNMVLFTETPSSFAIPWDIVGVIIVVSLLILTLGLRGILKNLKKQNLIEIYRATQ